MAGKQSRSQGVQGKFISQNQIVGQQGINLIERMVLEGRLGRKNGKGFYRYSPDGKRLPREDR